PPRAHRHLPSFPTRRSSDLELGAIKQIRASWLGGGLPVREGHPATEEQMRNWLFYRAKSGDIIVEQNCHNLDVVNWFMGTHPTRDRKSTRLNSSHEWISYAA